MIAGIDTDAGKTLIAALLCKGLQADYWKPVQCGTQPETDSMAVSRMAGLSPERIHPESYLLQAPQSPHAAAAKEGVRIDPATIQAPESAQTLIIEGAGGLMVPLNDKDLYIDLMAAWDLPLILVVRTYLGCINHSLLSLEAIHRRKLPLHGIIFNEGGHPESEKVILDHAQAPLLGKVPVMEKISPESLGELFRANFRVELF